VFRYGFANSLLLYRVCPVDGLMVISSCCWLCFSC